MNAVLLLGVADDNDPTVPPKDLGDLIVELMERENPPKPTPEPDPRREAMTAWYRRVMSAIDAIDEDGRFDMNRKFLEPADIDVIQIVESLASMAMTEIPYVQKLLSDVMGILRTGGANQDGRRAHALEIVRNHRGNVQELCDGLRLQVSIGFIYLKTDEVSDVLSRANIKSGNEFSKGEPWILEQLNRLSGYPLGRVDARALSTSKAAFNKSR